MDRLVVFQSSLTLAQETLVVVGSLLLAFIWAFVAKKLYKDEE